MKSNCSSFNGYLSGYPLILLTSHPIKVAGVLGPSSSSPAVQFWHSCRMGGVRLNLKKKHIKETTFEKFDNFDEVF
jgi:hypothetical protein